MSAPGSADVGPEVIRPENIPVKLRALPWWACWRLVHRNGKPAKIAWSPRTNEEAHSSRPEDWTSFTEAWTSAKLHRHGGVGLLVKTGQGVTFTPLDDVRDLDALCEEIFGETAAAPDTSAENEDKDEGAPASVEDSPPPPSPAAQFLTDLFASKPTELYVLLWRLHDKSSHWFQDLDQAARFAQVHAAQDVYVGVSLSPADYGPHCRVTLTGERPPAGIVAFWADIDIAGEAHQKKNLPPTVEAALTVLPADFPPSLTVHSGHGLQSWWLFREPWIFETPEDLERAASLEARWLGLLQQRADAHGWVIDPVADLTRVFRMPGTTNNKVAGKPVLATILERTERRYNPSDFEEALEGVPMPARVSAGQSRAPEAGPLRLDPNAELPPALIDLMRQADPRFEATWRRDRPDLADQSQSSYDMSLADLGVEAGLTDQQITGMLIHHRRLHGKKRKLRQDYYQRTIAKARQAVDAPERESELTPDSASPGEGQPPQEIAAHADPQPPKDETSRLDGARQFVSKSLGLPVAKLLKYGSTNARFSLLLQDGRQFDLGTASVLASQHQLRVAILDGLNKQLPPLSRKMWRRTIDCLLELVEVQQTLEPLEMLAEWVEGYFHRNARRVQDLQEDTDTARYAWDQLHGELGESSPVYETKPGGVAILRLKFFFKHLFSAYSIKMSQPDLAALLAKAGFQPRSSIASPVWDGKRVRVNRVWVIPVKRLEHLGVNLNEESGPLSTWTSQHHHQGRHIQ